MNREGRTEDSQAIRSPSNPPAKRIRRLQLHTKTRQREKAFFVEGVSITLQAIVFSDALLADEKAHVEIAPQRALGTC